MHVSRIALSLAATAALVLTASANAAIVVDYTGSVAPDGTFGTFATAGAVTPSAAGLVINVPTEPGGGNNFGGAATNTSLLATPTLAPTSTISLTAQLGANNTSENVVLGFRTGNAAGPVFSYSIPTASFNTTGFTTVTISAAAPFFTDPGGAIPNGPVGEASVQSPFGPATALNLTVASIDVTAAAVPEPASLGVLALGGSLLLRRRR